jgi:hypothetical protein
MSTRGAWRPRLLPWRTASLVLVLAGILILPIASAQAAARGKPPKHSDVAAARALIAAQTHFYAAGLATRRETEAGIDAVIAQVKAQCPNALPATLLDGREVQRTVYRQLFTEGAFDIGIAALQPIGDATATEARALDRIHFSTRGVNRDLRELAASQRATLNLAPSDLCGDIKDAASGGFTGVPAATMQFIDHVQNTAGAAAPSFNQLVDDVRPDVLTRHDKAAVAHMRTLGVRYTSFAFGASIDAGGKLADALGASS